MRLFWPASHFNCKIQRCVIQGDVWLVQTVNCWKNAFAKENGHYSEISAAVREEVDFSFNYNFSGAKFLCKSHVVGCTSTNSISCLRCKASHSNQYVTITVLNLFSISRRSKGSIVHHQPSLDWSFFPLWAASWSHFLRDVSLQPEQRHHGQRYPGLVLRHG